MKWPLSQDFNEAVQNPRVVFRDADLRTGEAVVGARGLPLPRSGNFADVYQIRGADGRDWAVKCFTRPVTGLGERYAAISDALVQAKLPFTVDFTYLAEGIRIGGAWWPVVKMEWVEGLLLNQVIRENASRPAILAAFGQMWGKLCRKLRDTKVAHADLQHGNVLMVPGSRPGTYGLKLIDYDGMHVPALTNQPSGESGHPAYQHPGRTGKHGYSPDMDRFPHLLIATALKAMEVCGRPLWERYDSGDNLLFVEADIHDVANSVLMKELWQTQHPALQALVGRLAIAALRPMPQTPWLDQIAPEGEPLPLNEETRREAMQAFGLIPPLMVPLPPEPDAPPLHWGDIVEQPPALVVPTVLTGSGTAKALASKRKLAGVAEEEVPQPPDRGADKGPPLKRSPAAKASSTRLLVLGLGTLLVLAGGLALVLMNLGKPKPQVAEAESEEPAVPVSKPSKPKEANSTASTAKSDKPEVAKTNPIETLPDPIAAPEKIVTTPVPTDAPQVTIKERNRITLGETLTNFAAFDQDGEHLVVLGLPPKLISYEPQTGKASAPGGLRRAGHQRHTAFRNC